MKINPVEQSVGILYFATNRFVQYLITFIILLLRILHSRAWKQEKDIITHRPLMEYVGKVMLRDQYDSANPASHRRLVITSKIHKSALI